MQKLTETVKSTTKMWVFDKIAGLLLGTFTNLEKTYDKHYIYRIVQDFIAKDLPVAKTSEVGHDINSKILTIGGKINIKNFQSS